jgi:hypothetical protein
MTRTTSAVNIDRIPLATHHHGKYSCGTVLRRSTEYAALRGAHSTSV